MWRLGLQPNSVFPDAFSHHLLWNEYPECIDDGVQHPLTDVILPDIERYAPLRQIISLYLSYIPLLLLTQEREVHLWNDGEAAVLIHDPYQSLDAACLIDVMTLAARLAERKGTVAQTLCLLHNPHVLILQILRLENRELAPATLGKIHVELLRVERYLQNAFTDIVGDGYAGIRLATKQGIEHEICLQFLNVEIHRWIVFPIVYDELG